ncbi:putative ThiF protein [Ordospora pajunii]|uniref:putative ThiF protein n=1 Tax=Ordospora pajunii TaxID=3039483 RepID=UPI0029526AAD|nr:putative ThiF protein [Ordospora pajunii]KAH9411874.1 putative ThiF protein [Ordospora pajunii]
MFLESDLSMSDAERYSRQAIVEGVGIEGQRRLGDSSVLVVGCGGLGIPVIMYLSSCGLRRIGLVDFDKIEIHNLPRQVLYTEDDVSEYKVMVASEFLRRSNSSISASVYNEVLDVTNAERIINEYDVVVDCTDRIETRYLLNDFCRMLKKGLVCGSVLQWEGQIYKLMPSGPCYRCLFPSMKAEVLTCENAGVVGPLCGIVGSMQALEVIKLILGDDESRMIAFNGMTFETIAAKLRKSKSICNMCTKEDVNGNNLCKDLHTQRCDDAGEELSCKSWHEIISDLDSWLVLDVRPVIQYRMLRAKGSVNVPLDELKSKIEMIRALGPSIGKKVCVVCKRGITSKKGAKILRDEGVEAYSIYGGITDLKNQMNKND